MDRGKVHSVPYFKQDMPFMLIKLSDVRSTFWLQTETVQAVYKTLDRDYFGNEKEPV